MIADLFSLDFVQRGHCGNWNLGFLYLYVLSNALITAAYVAIPSILASQWYRVSLEPLMDPMPVTTRRGVVLAYSAFIGSCGVGHLEGLLAFQWPLYHLFAMWHLVTAICSWIAVWVTWQARARIVGLFWGR